MPERTKTLDGIRRCLSDAQSLFQEVMDTLNEIGKGDFGMTLTPFVGGLAMKDPAKNFRNALIKLDSAEKVLQPLAVRLRDGRVNSSHFKDERAIVLVRDLAEFDYGQLIKLLAQRRGRETVWYRLDELSKKAREAYQLVSTD